MSGFRLTLRKRRTGLSAAGWVLVCLGLAGVEAEPVLLGLDQRGVGVHSGSSCSSELLEPSPVLRAMGVDADRSLRVSVGWPSTPADVEAFAAAFPKVMEQLRALRGSAREEVRG